MISTLEIARRLGITSVAVNNRIKKLEIEKIRRGVFAYVTEDDFERIAKLPLEPSEQTTSISTNTNSFTKFPPVDPLISENRALRQQLNDLQQEIQQKDLQQQEQLRMRQIDVEQERSTALHQLQEKVKLLQEARRERTELKVLLFREQDLASQTHKELEQAQTQIKQLQQLPMVELQKWIKLLEASHNTFANNLKLLSIPPSPPLIVHEGGKKELQSFYKQFAK